jgi:hypothetical protein
VNGSGAARRVLVCVMTPSGGVVARLLEPARLRPPSSVPPWRGEGMTGTRAPRAAHSQRLPAMELPPAPQLSTEEVQNSANRSLSTASCLSP